MNSVSSSSGSLTGVAATTIPGTESVDLVPRDRLRQRDHGHRFSPREGWSLNEKQIARNIRRYYKQKSHEALHQQRSFSRRTVAAATKGFSKKSPCRSINAGISVFTQLIAEFQSIKRDTFAEKDEFKSIQMEKFAFQAEETIEAQRNLYNQEAGEELRRNEDASSRLFNDLEDRLQNQYQESASLNSACEAIEYGRPRLQKSRIMSVAGDSETRYSAPTKMIQILKQLDDASKQSQEETKSLPSDTTLLQRLTSRVCF